MPEQTIGMDAPRPARKDIVEALIREFLKGDGCSSAYDAFEATHPRRSTSITQRGALCELLGIESSWKELRKRSPRVTVLETLVHHRTEKRRSKKDKHSAKPMDGETKDAHNENDWTIKTAKHTPMDRDSPSPPSTAHGKPSSRVLATSPAGHRSSHAHRDLISDSGTASFKGCNDCYLDFASSRPTSRDLDEGTATRDVSDISRNPDRRSSRQSFGEESEMASGAHRSKVSAGGWTQDNQTVDAVSRNVHERNLFSKPQGMESRQSGHLEMELADVDEFDELDLPSSLHSRPQVGNSMKRTASLLGESISVDLAQSMHKLLWGSQCRPSDTWKQGFYFNDRPGLSFGLVQRQGGPCGVLAAVQGHILGERWFHCRAMGSFEFTRKQQEEALLDGMAAALVLVAAGGPVKIIQCFDGDIETLTYKQLSRNCKSWTAMGHAETKEKLANRISHYVDHDGWGIVLFLFSVILTKGVDNIKSEMDDAGVCLTGEHGYCSQELVNLLLTGTAATNVFDGQQDCGGTILRGIERRPGLGLLTLLEWYRYLEVGDFLKRPELPIWVVCSESHFTVLFATEDEQPSLSTGCFDLMYYDGLANQEDVIRLTVLKCSEGGLSRRIGDSFSERANADEHGNLIPPLECVIETRWRGSIVHWNGCEPIL
ncbi:hypothetical protein BSKO_03948 [Bryopsis sp. KO-2023]|nr:hypothetical protein BSKO_03948 [Bryopsis sp. KO-2023]